MVMVESVQCKTWDPIETIIIDLENEVYANLRNGIQIFHLLMNALS